jgi:hypothetical protein
MNWLDRRGEFRNFVWLFVTKSHGKHGKDSIFIIYAEDKEMPFWGGSGLIKLARSRGRYGKNGIFIIYVEDKEMPF